MVTQMRSSGTDRPKIRRTRCFRYPGAQICELRNRLIAIRRSHDSSSVFRGSSSKNRLPEERIQTRVHRRDMVDRHRRAARIYKLGENSSLGSRPRRLAAPGKVYAGRFGEGQDHALGHPQTRISGIHKQTQARATRSISLISHLVPEV